MTFTPSPLVPSSPIIAQLPWNGSLSVAGVAHLICPSDILLVVWECYLECAFGQIRVRWTNQPATMGGTIVTCTNMMRLDERDVTAIGATLEGSNLPAPPDQTAWTDAQEAFFPGAGGSSGPFQPWRARDAQAYPIILLPGEALEFQLPGAGAGISGRVIPIWDELPGPGGPT